MTDRAIALLNEQQSKVKERSAPWMVAEQLKDICRQEPDIAGAMLSMMGEDEEK